MMKRSMLICAFGLLALTTTAAFQNFAPPKSIVPAEDQLAALKKRVLDLEKEVKERRRNERDPMLADIEVFLKAADWTIEHGEFYHADTVKWVNNAIDTGMFRASKSRAADYGWYRDEGHTVIRGYRSGIDGSVQPYAVTLPVGYEKNVNRKYPMHIVLHGRQNDLTEVSFIQKHSGKKASDKLDHIILEVYGRGNNAYRWAGEMDVQEATQFFLGTERGLGRDLRVDTSKVVLRGFSMGGAGTWHLGLHKPDRFCVLGPGAGFTTTHGYAPNLPAKLPDYQEKCLRIYDAVDYAENVANVPVVAYSGSEDEQKKAAYNIEDRLKGTPYKITHLIGKGLGHSFPPAEQAKAEAEYDKHVKDGRADYPQRVRFVTYTMRYHMCDWVEILGLEQHYEKALVDAQWLVNEKKYQITTQNVRTLHIGVPSSYEKFTVQIDKNTLEDVFPYRPAQGSLAHIYLQKGKDGWQAVWPAKITTDLARIPQKKFGLHGPIDDAFTWPFLCVRGTGKPWNKAVHDHAMASLERFEKEWDKWMRGKLPIKDDTELTDVDLLSKHLVLFGDPGSNKLIAEALDRLPLTWTQKSVTLAGEEKPAANHMPVMIYPSPWTTEKYVVLNSGHTFHEEDYKGTNALLYPRLGDYALLELTGDEKKPLAMKVVKAGLFDDFWKVQK